MDLTAINSAIDAAYAAALANPQRVLPATIAENVTLQTDTYVAPTGSGFRVVCRIKVPEANFTATKVRNHGPDIASEREWPSEGIEAAAQAHVARCVALGEAHVAKANFTSTRLTALLRRFMEVKEACATAVPPVDIAEAKPKLVALYQWTATVEQTALSGQTYFTPAPHTFEEVMAE